MNLKRHNGFSLIELLVTVALLAVLSALLLPVLARLQEQGRRAACQNNLKQLGIAFQLYLGDWDQTYPNPYDGSRKTDTGRIFLTWKRAIFRYAASPGVFKCPSNGFTERALAQLPKNDTVRTFQEVEAPLDYAMNGTTYGRGHVRDAEIRRPSHTLLLLELQASLPVYNFGRLIDEVTTYRRGEFKEVESHLKPPYGFSLFTHTGEGRANWLFSDGSLRALRFRDTLVPRQMWADDDYLENADPQAYARDFVAHLPPRWR